MGLNYQRLTEREKVQELVTAKIDEAIARGGKFGPISWEMRNKSCLCKADAEKLQVLVAQITEMNEKAEVE